MSTQGKDLHTSEGLPLKPDPVAFVELSKKKKKKSQDTPKASSAQIHHFLNCSNAPGTDPLWRTCQLAVPLGTPVGAGLVSPPPPCSQRGRGALGALGRARRELNRLSWECNGENTFKSIKWKKK